MKLKEFLQESMTSADAAGFVGASGQGVDKTAAGPFYPSVDDLLLLLKQQNIDTMVKQKFSNLYTPFLKKTFELAYKEGMFKFDEDGDAYSIKELIYDESGIDNSEEFVDKWKNDSNQMKFVDILGDFDENNK